MSQSQSVNMKFLSQTQSLTFTPVTNKHFYTSSESEKNFCILLHILSFPHLKNQSTKKFKPINMPREQKQ